MGNNHTTTSSNVTAYPETFTDYESQFKLNLDKLPKDVYATAQKVSQSIDIDHLSSAAVVTRTVEANKGIAEAAKSGDANQCRVAEQAIRENTDLARQYLDDRRARWDNLWEMIKGGAKKAAQFALIYVCFSSSE